MRHVKLRIHVSVATTRSHPRRHRAEFPGVGAALLAGGQHHPLNFALPVSPCVVALSLIPRLHKRSLSFVIEGLSWEVAEQVGMTVSGAWSRYRRGRPPKPPPLGRWQQVLVDALDQNLAIGRLRT